MRLRDYYEGVGENLAIALTVILWILSIVGTVIGVVLLLVSLGVFPGLAVLISFVAAVVVGVLTYPIVMYILNRY